MRKTTFAILILLSSTVFSGTMGSSCNPGNVTVPCIHSAWDIGGEALYLQTTFNKEFSYYPTGLNGIYNDQSGQWNWGFKLEGWYHFNTGSDININWYHLDNDLANFAFEPLGEFSGVTIQLGLKNKWDAVNGELAQFVEFSKNTKMRFHGGFQFSRIKTSINTIISTDEFIFVPLTPSSITQTIYSEGFNGFGPRTGLELNYYLNDGFSIYTQAATSLLVGTANSNVSSSNNLSGFIRSSKTAVVPELEAKVGINYTYGMAQGNLVLDVGYFWFNYFNPLSNQNSLAKIQFNPAVANAYASTDFGACGPYIGLKYRGNI